MPLLCFVLPPSRFDEDFKSTQRYTAPSKGGDTVSQVLSAQVQAPLCALHAVIALQCKHGSIHSMSLLSR